MAKIKGYQSPFATLVSKLTFLKTARDWFDINIRKSPNFGPGYQGLDEPTDKFGYKLAAVLGGLNPLVSSGKDFVDTFKPYKSNYYILRDVLQPIRGFGNVVNGGFNVVAAPLLFLTDIASNAFHAANDEPKNILYRMGIGERISSSDRVKHFFSLMRASTLIAVGGFVNGITNIGRGVTQIASTPLTYLFRIPLRGVITLFKGKPKLEDTLKLQTKAVQKKTGGDSLNIHNNDEDVRKIHSEIHRKMVKGTLRGQSSKTQVSLEKHDYHRAHFIPEAGVHLTNWKNSDYLQYSKDIRHYRENQHQEGLFFFTNNLKPTVPVNAASEKTSLVADNSDSQSPYLDY